MDGGSKLKRLYLDNAATSWPKPPAVIDAIATFYRENGTAASRGNASSHTDRSVDIVRQGVADFINADSKKEIVFAFNCTDALNIALHGSLSPGDHVVASGLEHNSVLRPLNYLAAQRQVEFSIVDTDSDGVIDPAALESEIKSNTKMVCLSHVSNVTGVVQPVAAVGEICRRRSVMFLVDAAQSLGHIPVDVKAFQCDLLAAPGHKGLLGPLGTAVLYVGEHVAERVEPFRQGGTGSISDNESQPNEMPTKLEAGNLNVGGILGLGAGLAFVRESPFAEIMAHGADLGGRLLEGLCRIEQVEVYMAHAGERIAVISFNVGREDPREVAAILASHFGIEVRAGLHCAPRAHKFLGTLARGGSLRVSPGVFNTIDEIDRMVDAIREIAEHMD
jgi:cysteine desulfurase family protein